MKTLELNQMENVQGEGFWSGLACGGAILAGAALFAGSGGLGAFAAYTLGGIACAGALEMEQ